MSQKELAPLFPSATHPALPVAAQILGTLRDLTAPGKGNDIRPEERAALVGVAALLGCERIQSHDLHQAAVQRVVSVSPARFKTAMATSRRLLSEVDKTASPSRSRLGSTSSSANSSPSQSGSRIGAGVTQSVSIPAPTLSPFSTPKKKYKYTSGVDISGLLTPHRHSPAKASPLKQSVTPSDGGTPSKSVRRPSKLVPTDDEASDDGDGEVQLKTPTKRRPAAAAPLSKDATPTRANTRDLASDTQSSSRRAKERESVAAFFALRPGASTTPHATATTASTRKRKAPGPAGDDLEADFPSVHAVDPLNDLGRSARRAAVARKAKTRAAIKRQDWTFRERVWGSAPVTSPTEQGVDPEESGRAWRREQLDKTWKALAEFEAQSGGSSKDLGGRGAKTAESIILAAWA